MSHLSKISFFFGFFCSQWLGIQATELVLDGKSYINMHFGGRLGNQMFQVAAAVSLAKDHDAQAIFPDLIHRHGEDIPLNHKIFFSELLTFEPPTPAVYTFFEHPHFHFTPIPFHPNMEIYGYFQSEKYFKHNKDFICEMFEPSEKIKEYIVEKYSELLTHPHTVAIHMRAFKVEHPEIDKCFPFLTADYFIKAANLFPEEALFVIFSDKIDWAKEELKDFNRPHLFIEGEEHYHDLYLMSFCKHQIISSSSFSWWGAYLNKNPDKRVIAPYPWFSPISGHDSSNVLPDGWYKLPWQE